MNKELFKNMAIVLLISISATGVFKYLVTMKQKSALQHELAQAEAMIDVLSQEKQNLLQDIEKEKATVSQLNQKNTSLKDYLRAGRRRMEGLFRDSARTQNELDEVRARFAVLKTENRILVETRGRAYQENQELKEKLSSVRELKKAIRELKRRRRTGAGVQTEGNHGFLIKDGHPTSAPKVRIEVVPAKAGY